MVIFGKLTEEQTVSKAIIELQNQQPFFARLIMSLKLIKDDKKELPDWAMMGVDTSNRLIYNIDKIKSLNIEQLKFCICHEVMHCALGHLFRLNNRDPMGWNIATDLCINLMLRANHMSPPDGVLMPDFNKNYTIEGGQQLIDIDKKTAEQIYDELPKPKKQSCSGDNYKGQFDEHFSGSKVSQADVEKAAEQWKDNMVAAAVYGKQMGKIPMGMDRYISDILQPKINWKSLLQKYVMRAMLSDYTWSKPSRRSISTGVYMPSMLKEAIEIIVHVDSSGSIGQAGLTEFLSEVVGMARSFSNINITLIECDCVIQQVLEVRNGNIDKIMGMKIKGGGGTSHRPVVEFILDEKPNARVLISLTDGFSDIKDCFEELPCEKIIVLSKVYTDDDLSEYGLIVKMED